jgi:hypothetical protein
VANRVHLSQEIAQRISDALNEANDQAKISVKNEIRNYEKILDGLDLKRDQLFDLFVNHTITEEEYRRQGNRIQNERRSYTRLLEQSQLSISDAWRVTAQKVFELAIHAKSIWESGSTQEKLNYLKELCSNPVLDESSVRYELKKPYGTVAEMKEKEWRTRRDSNPRPTGSKPATLSS